MQDNEFLYKMSQLWFQLSMSVLKSAVTLRLFYSYLNFSPFKNIFSDNKIKRLFLKGG